MKVLWLFKRLMEDNEYVFFIVILFWKVVDNFKIVGRERGFLVSDFVCVDVVMMGVEIMNVLVLYVGV